MENLRVTKKTIKAHPDTFQAELHITVVIPLQYCVDTADKMSKEEFARTFGADLLNLMQNTPLTEDQL